MADGFRKQARRDEALAVMEKRIGEEARDGFPASDTPSRTAVTGRVGAAGSSAPGGKAAPVAVGGARRLLARLAAPEATPLPSGPGGTVPLQQRPDADPAPSMQSETGHPARSELRLAFFPGSIVVVFGASEYPAPIRFRLFHIEERRFEGVAYRVAPTPGGPDGSTTWTPDAFREADLLQVADHIPSIRIAAAGCPTVLEVGDDDLAMLIEKARPPRRFVGPWRRRGVGLPRAPSAAVGT